MVDKSCRVNNIFNYINELQSIKVNETINDYVHFLSAKAVPYWLEEQG